MPRVQKSLAETKTGRPELDASDPPDSSCRSARTDLGLDLHLVEGEAALVFAHLRDVLAETIAAEFEGGEASR
jgi:tRNA(Ile)-lysidine synthase TilS/MesJ